MEDKGTFKPVSSTSENRMYGPRCVLVSGLDAEEQSIMLKLLDNFSELPLIVAHEEDMDTVLGELLKREHASGTGRDSSVMRLVLMSGITQKELHALMRSYREAGLPRPLWAALTPTSEQWTLRDLLKELEAERRAFEETQQQDS